MKKIESWIGVAEDLLDLMEEKLLRLPREYALGVCDLICDVLYEGINAFNHRQDDTDAIVLWRRLARAWIRYKRCVSLIKQADRVGHLEGGTLLESIGVRDWRLVKRLTIDNEELPGETLKVLIADQNKYLSLVASMSVRNRLIQLIIKELKSYIDSVLVSDDFFSDELAAEKARRERAKESLEYWERYWDGLLDHALLPSRNGSETTPYMPEEKAAGGWIAD